MGTLVSVMTGAMPLALAGLLVVPLLLVGLGRYTRVSSPIAERGRDGGADAADDSDVAHQPRRQREGRVSRAAGTLAVEYLLATREGGDAARGLERELAHLDPDELARALADDDARVAFWIDLYNAAVLGQPRPDLLHLLARERFFRRPLVTVAGQALSLDTIEHGLLRRSRWKLGLGYLPSLRPSPFERTHRVGWVDPRIHFALNCAAASCPAIAAYHGDQLDEQLERATRAYLRSSVVTDPGGITIPMLFLWFIGDFGGPPGVRRFLRDHGVDAWGRRLRFASWDWTPTPGAWTRLEAGPGRTDDGA